jgi:hypothetical protein
VRCYRQSHSQKNIPEEWDEDAAAAVLVAVLVVPDGELLAVPVLTVTLDNVPVNVYGLAEEGVKLPGTGGSAAFPSIVHTPDVIAGHSQLPTEVVGVYSAIAMLVGDTAAHAAFKF